MTVHPRRRGEHPSRRCALRSRAGSSPQARGTRPPQASIQRGSRFIPAGAGNTCSFADSASSLTVHPRRRGEHTSAAQASRTPTGSSPQARGTLKLRAVGSVVTWFIPAGAGNTLQVGVHEVGVAVHPRRRGEHAQHLLGVHLALGSSPQARGTPDPICDRDLSTRFIPAGAGNTLSYADTATQYAVHPRRRGEHLFHQPNTDRVVGSSPQARGTQPRVRRPRRGPRFIPAGAGNTVLTVAGDPILTVHPRRRGEHSGSGSTSTGGSGSSPQARGTHRRGRIPYI